VSDYDDEESVVKWFVDKRVCAFDIPSGEDAQTFQSRSRKKMSIHVDTTGEEKVIRVKPRKVIPTDGTRFDKTKTSIEGFDQPKDEAWSRIKEEDTSIEVTSKLYDGEGANFPNQEDKALFRSSFNGTRRGVSFVVSYPGRSVAPEVLSGAGFGANKKVMDIDHFKKNQKFVGSVQVDLYRALKVTSIRNLNGENVLEQVQYFIDKVGEVVNKSSDLVATVKDLDKKGNKYKVWNSTDTKAKLRANVPSSNIKMPKMNVWLAIAKGIIDLYQEQDFSNKSLLGQGIVRFYGYHTVADSEGTFSDDVYFAGKGVNGLIEGSDKKVLLNGNTVSCKFELHVSEKATFFFDVSTMVQAENDPNHGPTKPTVDCLQKVSISSVGNKDVTAQDDWEKVNVNIK